LLGQNGVPVQPTTASWHKTKSHIWPAHAYSHVGSELTKWQQKMNIFKQTR
jgi:hypothetical protein